MEVGDYAPAALLHGNDMLPTVLGGWMGPRASLDRCIKSGPYWNSILGLSSL